MPLNFMVNENKIKSILKERELLKVNSLNKAVAPESRKSLLILASGVYIIGLAYGLWISTDINNLMVMWSITLTLLYGFSIFIIIFLTTAKGSPLIITEKGIVCRPIVAEFWEDIESYNWEEFKGGTCMPGSTLFSIGEGISLKLKTKGLLPRTQLQGRTIFGTYLIFFSPEQMAITENIFDQQGINKSQ
ncbi:MAG: hypothetical protein EPN25_00015 [Nitrospirae bacterium]|nr:MAG: hypothetical protein EPN25_00015 [Nitrospirota bacterium]